jgi:hypothetical protein
MVSSLSTLPVELVSKEKYDEWHNTVELISKEQYDEWYNTFLLFDKLKGLSLGQSFAEHFKTTDFILKLDLSDSTTISHIENNYIK